jgi:hypothetical protein
MGKSLGNSRMGLQDNVRMYLEEMDCEEVNCIKVNQYHGQWVASVFAAVASLNGCLRSLGLIIILTYKCSVPVA